MRRMRRVICLAFAVLMLVNLAMPCADAVGTVYFTAVNDTLLPLNDETMPFWSGGVFYVSSAAFDGTDLGTYYSRSRDKSTALLYKQRSVIIFNLAAGTIETNSGQTYSGCAVTRGDVVFVPLDIVCRYFGFEYSYARVSYGYLVRLKSDSVVLSDATFIDAASSPMAQRYARYERAQTEQTDTETPPAENTQTTEPSPRTVYFAIESTDAEKTAPLLTRLSGGRAAYLFAPDALNGADELLRRLAAGNGSIALRVDGSAGAESALAQIEAANRMIWAAANTKTRLVLLDGATEETVRRITDFGYCPLTFALNFSGGVSAARMSTRILSAADERGGSCRVFLGTDEQASAVLGALLANLRTGNCTPARLNEVTLYQG